MVGLRSKLALASVLLALAAAMSCKTFDLPSETCDPSALNARRLSPTGDGDCSRCLEDHCCDLVGVCERTERCAETVRSTHACVLEANLKGASVENRCAEQHGLLDQPSAADAYRCMRDGCGQQCGLPVCRVDKAAILIQNAKCDQCFAGGCCPELNRCYDNRACKLMIECINAGCGGTLGASMVALAASASQGELQLDPTQDSQALCTKEAPPDFRAPECVRTCLCKYRDNDQGLTPTDSELRPFNLALRVYQCGVAAACGEDCAVGPDDAAAP